MILRYANLLLLVLFPIAWFSPLLRAGILPYFGLKEITVMSGLQTLWASDPVFALLVTFFAIFAPYIKTLGIALTHFDMMDRKALPFFTLLGRLAMADIFMLALYVVVIKGIGIGRVETAWGLYLFSGCILASLAISYGTAKR